MEALRCVLAGHAVIRVDFRREEILHALARWAIDKVIGRMLVRPGRASAVATDDLEDRVHFDEIVREDWNALALHQREREVCRVNLRERLAERSAPVHAGRILVEAFVIGRNRARRTLAVRAWR